MNTMRAYPVDPQMREAWKTYPLRLSGLSKSPCCGASTVLVQSMEGGYVTRNCAECGGKDSLPERVFYELGLWVACPECNQEMQSRLVAKNYTYACEQCQLYVRLADLLPRWTDL